MKLRRDVPFEVVSVEPGDGARGVFRDDPIVLLLSGPADADCRPQASVEVRPGGRPVPVRVEWLHGGRALVLRPSVPLGAGCEHRLVVTGLKDARGRVAPPLETGFTTGALAGLEIVSDTPPGTLPEGPLY